ncbi:formylglycine-generating enzyme family protein [Foetidibacter luteolus]|uniref:formylglycine-generating enzyme family protein n=1 Tax=Foetidibacter luteolus TaxID=2608880 RepID=UPI00129BAF4E|nr:SUMF1/EgtB/PvdO family nonheme iron enzyme [Foetidibacter luteolus]
MKQLITLLNVCLAFSSFAQNSVGDFKPYETTIPGSTVKFTMTPIPAGSFDMGSSDKDPLHKPDEGPQKQVTVDAFWMGVHEVTYDEFLLFFNDQATSVNSDVDAVTRPTPQYIDLSWGMGKAGGFPVNSMSQMAAATYCRWLYKKTGVFYRLPTEAEWEYASRAGKTTAYYFGDDSASLGDYGWFAGNSGLKYHKVGEKKPNAWGLYDMLGNVAEWTLDQYDENYFTTIGDNPKNPLVPAEKRYPRSVRGGGYLENAGALRCASRDKSIASWNRRDPQIPKSKWWLTDGMQVGFRLVRPLVQPSADEIEAFYKNYTGR